MRLALITDAWSPQVNGVVRTLQEMVKRLRADGHDVIVISPDQYSSVPCPGYSEIRLALTGTGNVGRRLAQFAPDAIHIATEGPLGVAARKYCVRSALPFTSAYHTQFPDYVAKRLGISPDLIWPYIRWFHGRSRRILVATQSVRNQLANQGLHHVAHWGRGVDLDCFTPDAPAPELYAKLPRPIQLYVGRIAIEKNITAFLDSTHNGSKIIVGDGPARAQLQAQYPDAHFVGVQKGRALAGYYAGADVFVFPSKTDTFGLVMIEALACGTPVAAHVVAGPIDIVTSQCGHLSDDLDHAIGMALTKNRQHCLDHGRSFTWENSVNQFIDGLVMLNGDNDKLAA